MRFAVLGDDPLVLSLAETAVALGHELVWIGEAADPEIWWSFAPRALWNEPWELLVGHPTVEAVFVGRAAEEELRAEQLRKLVQADVHLLVAQPVVQSMLVYYELEMIRQTTQGVLRHYSPGETHPFVARLAELAAAGEASPLGRIEQLVFERRLIDRSPRAVLAQLARDADLLLPIAGVPDRLGAVGASDDPAVYAALGVQWSGPQGISVRWSVLPAATEADARLIAIAAYGQAVLEMPVEEAWLLEIAARGEPVERVELEWDAAETAIDEFTIAIEQGDSGKDWARACLGVEMADATVRSLERQRTIPLYHEEFSEQNTFKGTMTSIGCALILNIVLLLIAVGLLGDVIGLPAGVMRLWPWALLTVLGLYLALQILPKIVFPQSSEARSQENTPD